MTRNITDPPAANRGARRWLQALVNGGPAQRRRLDAAIAERLPFSGIIEWRSPLREDHYAEYSDQEFVERLLSADGYTERGLFPSPGRQLPRPLAEFWPRFGPQWDGLAVVKTGPSTRAMLLVEAKTHIPEMAAAPAQARGESALQHIRQSLDATRNFLEVRTAADWSVSFYQYANRLAQLYWLRELNGIDAYLVNLFFLNDAELNGPRTAAEWQAASRLQEVFLGLRAGAQNGYALHPWVGAYCLEVFIDTDAIPVRYPPPVSARP